MTQDLFNPEPTVKPKPKATHRTRAQWKGEPTKFLSLGAGVQSSVLLMLAICGEIERPDHVVFSDTGWEPAAVYEHLKWLRRQCMKTGIPMHITRADTPRVQHIRDDALHGHRTKTGIVRLDGRMPLFVDDDTGREGTITRRCSREYKVQPIRKLQRKLMGYKPGQRIPFSRCETMIGFSTDEKRRARPSQDVWNDNLFPLITDVQMSRNDCQAWWDKHYPHRRLQKSACIGCPFHTNAEWARMKVEAPNEFADACDFDDHIRKVGGLRATTYLHRSLKPLREVDLNEGQDALDLQEHLSCTGGCGT
jgi:hypothetical protein